MVPQNIIVECADGYELSATLYSPTTNNDVKHALMFAPATGIKRGFYDAIAKHFANLGCGVITFDNRGIADSLHGSAKDSKATIRDWGYLDMPAVLDSLGAHFPNAKYHLVGHSAGGQLVGLMHNHSKLSSMFNVACSSGQLSNLSPFFKLKAHFFMNGFMPLSNAIFGCANNQWFGMGEPLPKQVSKEWTTWCNGAGYVETAFGTTVKQHWYDCVDCPAYWINASDDEIANDTNVADMMRVYTKQPQKRLHLVPKEHNLKEIGHMKFFSRKSKALWKLLEDWLENPN